MLCESRERLVAIYGEDYTMQDICRGCKRGGTCACTRCLDGDDDEYLPPSYLDAMAKKAGEAAGKRLAKDGGCVVLRDETGRAMGFACRRGR